MAKTSIADWITISRNINQIQECRNHILEKLESQNDNTIRKSSNLIERLKTSRKKLAERFKEEYPAMSGTYNFIQLKKTGAEWLYYIEKREIILKSEVEKTQALLDKTDDDVGLFNVKSAAIIDNTPHKQLTESDDNLVSMGNESETSMDNWREISNSCKIMKQSYMNIMSTSLPKTSFNHDSLSKAIGSLRSQLEEQMFNEYPEEASTDIFY